MRKKMIAVQNNLGLLVAGFGFGAVLSGTVASWESLGLSYRLFFVVALCFILYICISLVVKTVDEKANKGEE